MKDKIQQAKKVQKIDPNTTAWDKLANGLARSLVPIKPCKECGYPVVDGYCCGACGSTSP